MAPTISVRNIHGVIKINGDDLIKHIKCNMYMENEKKPKCFTFHLDNGAPMYYDTSGEVNEIMKNVCKLKKQGIRILRGCNLIEYKIGKTKIYGFVVQYCDDTRNSLDVIACSLGIYVAGYVYWFFNQENRDNMYAWLTK